VGLIIAASDESVPRASDGLDERWRFRIITELLPQSAHEDIDRAIVGFEIDPVRCVENAIATEDAPTIPHQQLKQLEFSWREREHSAVQPY
jgi:hypothetical protein